MKKIFLFLFFVELMLFSILVNAYVEADLEKLLKTKKCQGGNLTHAKLIDADLKDSYLFCTNFAGADLSKADLHGAYLVGANLVGAKLIEANLSETNMAGVNFFWADLTGADLTRADLRGANISAAVFAKAKFKDTVWIDGKNYDENPWTPQESFRFDRSKIIKTE